MGLYCHCIGNKNTVRGKNSVGKNFGKSSVMKQITWKTLANLLAGLRFFIVLIDIGRKIG